MLLAIETATDRASVALGVPGADPLEENRGRRPAARRRASADDPEPPSAGGRLARLT